MMLRLVSKPFTCRALLWSRQLLQNTQLPTCNFTALLHRTNCKYSISTINLLSRCKNKLHSATTEYADKKVNQVRNVKDLLDLYVLSRDLEHGVDPLLTLDSITKITRKSAKESVLLMKDPDIAGNFDTLLKDVQVILDDSPQMVVNVLCSLAAISAKQKAYLDRTGVVIYPCDVSRAQQSHVGKDLFLQYEDFILSGLHDIQMKELLCILRHFAETKVGSKDLANKVKNRISRLRMEDLNLEDITQIIVCLAKLKSTVHSSALMIQMKRELLSRGLVRLTMQEIVDVLFSFVTAESGDLNILKEIMNDILSRDIRIYTPSQKCKILWSFTKAKVKKCGVDFSDLLNLFEEKLLRKGLKQFDVPGLAVVAWAYTMNGRPSEQFLKLLRHDTERRNFRDFTPDDITVLVKSFAKVKNKIPLEKLFFKFRRELLRHNGFAGFSDRQLVTTLWSYVHTGCGSTAFYNLIKEEILKRDIHDFTGMDFAQTMWSFAKVRDKIDTRNIFVNVRYDLSKLSLRQVALVGWSYAASNVIHGKVCSNLITEFCKRDIRKASNQVICQIMFTLATFEDVASTRHQVQNIEQQIIKNGANHFDNRQISLLVFSFSELYSLTKSSKIYQVLGEEICCRSFDRYMPSDICHILWGFAHVKHLVDTTLIFRSFSRELLERDLSEFTIPQITMATVAMSMARQWDDQTLRYFKKEIFCHENPNEFDGLHLCSLAKSFLLMNPSDSHDFFLWLEEEIVDRNASTLLPRDLAEILHILVERGKSNDFFPTVINQLVTSKLDNYSNEDIKNVCDLLAQTGIDISELQFSLRS